MNTQNLIDTARALVADDKGLLAMDESNPTATNDCQVGGFPRPEEAPARLSGVDCDRARSR